MKNISRPQLFLIKFVIISLMFLSLTAIAMDETDLVATNKNLYKVKIGSIDEANRLKATGSEPVLRISGGYLVLQNPAYESLLLESQLETELLATQINRNELVLDMNRDGSNIGKYPLVYSDGELRLFRADIDEVQKSVPTPGLAPLRTERLKIIYREPGKPKPVTEFRTADLTTLISEVKQDSLESYLDVLQAYDPRVAGTDANYVSRDWCAGKFAEFGYDSVVIDSFQQLIYGYTEECQNVIAYKVGSTYPEFQIVVGAHRDAVPGSPGADDNGTGTGAVLEIARVLSEVETVLTIVFVLFDAEEQGLYGSWYYANRAANSGDSIVMMLNMDMIAYYENSNQAALYTGTNNQYATYWHSLASTLLGINITGNFAGSSAYSDHHPFDQNGYDVVFVAEQIFSSVYHSPQDSTTYMNFDYFTRMVKASLATVYDVSDQFEPQPQLQFSYPGGLPDIQTPDLPLTLNVEVTSLYGGTPIVGSGYLNYSINGGSFSQIPFTDLGGGLFEITLPGQQCGSKIEFYFSINESGGETFYGYDYNNPFNLTVANGSEIIFTDNFDTDLGWTVTTTAADGPWERGIPAGGGSRGDPLADFDGSGYCYLTDNVAGNSDVDDGLTSLFSPTIDASSGVVRIDYARWYSNNFGAAPFADYMRVFISNDDGASWSPVEIVGPVNESSGGWYKHGFWLSDEILPSNQIKLRFNVSDEGDPSVVDAAIDAVTVRSYNCAFGPPEIITESIPGGTTNFEYSEQIYATGGTGTLTFSDKFNDLDGTGLSLSSDGIVAGIPIVSGMITFTAQVSDEADAMDEREYSINLDLGYLCGDADNDEMVNILDIVLIINYKYKDGPSPDPIYSADVDGVPGVDILDVVYLINFKYKNGPSLICQ